MKTEILNERLNELRENIDALSFGGCGFFALFLYESLVNKGFSPEIKVVHVNNNDYFKKVITNILNDSSDFEAKMNLFIQEISWRHFMVSVNDNLIDSNGVFPTFVNTGYSFFHNISEDSIPIELLKELLKKENLWNHSYDRNNNNNLKLEIENIIENIS